VVEDLRVLTSVSGMVTLLKFELGESRCCWEQALKDKERNTPITSTGFRIEIFIILVISFRTIV